MGRIHDREQLLGLAYTAKSGSAALKAHSSAWLSVPHNSVVVWIGSHDIPLRELGSRAQQCNSD